nr:MAG TPA: hypothetical protein [Caudoviricetes sp.]
MSKLSARETWEIFETLYGQGRTQLRSNYLNKHKTR